jgi:hypothetical protein
LTIDSKKKGTKSWLNIEDPLGVKTAKGTFTYMEMDLNGMDNIDITRCKRCRSPIVCKLTDVNKPTFIVCLPCGYSVPE